jgi:hypothetical protein
MVRIILAAAAVIALVGTVAVFEMSPSELPRQLQSLPLPT